VYGSRRAIGLRPKGAAKATALRQIVDDIFIPLVTTGQPTR
jgi:hypothetical protein